MCKEMPVIPVNKVGPIKSSATFYCVTSNSCVLISQSIGGKNGLCRIVPSASHPVNLQMGLSLSFVITCAGLCMPLIQAQATQAS
jgi:hypothetical protein